MKKRPHSSTDTETFHAASKGTNYFSPETTAPITTQQQKNEIEMVTHPVNLQDTNIRYPSINVTVQTNTTITNTQVTTDVGDTASDKNYIQPLPIFISDKNYNKSVKEFYKYWMSENLDATISKADGRSDCLPKHQKIFSRMKLIVQEVRKAAVNGKTVEEVLEEFTKIQKGKVLSTLLNKIKIREQGKYFKD